MKQESAKAGPDALLKNALPFEKIRIVPAKEGQDAVEDAAFASAVELDAKGCRFDLEPWTKPDVPAFIRAEFEVKKPGRYVLCAGADWYSVFRIDGQMVLDRSSGNISHPPKVTNHMAPVELTAGRHVLDIRFIRGTASAVLCMCIVPREAIRETAASADFTDVVGKVNPGLHNSNSAPDIHNRSLWKNDDAFRRMNFGMSRTHDWALWMCGQRLVDTHFIFPMMKLDPKDPSNYYFDATDEAIRICQEATGMKIFYRLGTSIEHSEGRHFNTLIPEDFEKYAEVLAGIVRHYTKGWANGFHYDIQYWEIWNEADLGNKMWCGDFDSFVPFFVTVLKRLKSEFPELKIGGPALTHLNLPKTKQLLEACAKAGVQPDFFSWHSYTSDPDGLVNLATQARELLDSLGFQDTELCINEWHYMESWEGVHAKVTPKSFQAAQRALHGANSAAFNIAVLAGWQYTLLDTAFYYGANWNGNFGFVTVDRQLDKNFHSMCLMGDVIRDFTELCPVRNSGSVRMMAAKSKDGSSAALLVSDLDGFDDVVNIDVRGLEKARLQSVVRLDEDSDNVPASAEWDGRKLRLKKEHAGSAVFLVRFEL